MGTIIGGTEPVVTLLQRLKKLDSLNSANAENSQVIMDCVIGFNSMIHYSSILEKEEAIAYLEKRNKNDTLVLLCAVKKSM